ncbi:MAG: hypothetical protein IPK46_04010 [Saprospiraceae bacterium]|nr:hypothetical protein [Saprospiraceae bacterium]
MDKLTLEEKAGGALVRVFESSKYPTMRRGIKNDWTSCTWFDVKADSVGLWVKNYGVKNFPHQFLCKQRKMPKSYKITRKGSCTFEQLIGSQHVELVYLKVSQIGQGKIGRRF